jgi:hypothetical protein
MINRVVRWDNGMVMVFDEYGEQMPEFQGEYSQVIDKILAAGWKGEIDHLNWRTDYVDIADRRIVDPEDKP